MKTYLRIFGVLSFLTFVPSSYGADDTSANAPGFASTLEQSPGLILRVTIDSQGREDTASAQLRVAPESASTGSNVENLFAQGINASGEAQITAQDIAADSSTCGFYPYTFSYGWMPSYYYNTITPVYYYSGYYYNYSTPFYYTNWNTYYRYYYYPIY